MDKRSEDQLIGLSHDPEDNIILTELEKEKESPLSEDDFFRVKSKKIGINVVKKKIANAFKKVFQNKAPRYRGEHDGGIYKMSAGAPDDIITVALLGDWGTFTDQSAEIARRVKTLNPGPHGETGIDYTIHLGDTYFTGSDDEIDQNFNPRHHLWPYGRLGSFALLGNHEMYSLATHYYKDLLGDWMGIRRNNERIRKQEYSYFCIQNDFWRIIGLDTATDAPWSVLKPGSVLEGNISLELLDDQVNWLKNEVKIPGDERGIILLSHHQPWGIFKKHGFIEPAHQLADPALIGENRRVLWFWVHEHQLSMYGCSSGPDLVKAFGRCLGHSGMPVEIGKKPNTAGGGLDLLALYDDRPRRRSDNKNQPLLGFNGFACITLDKENATIDYYDNNPKKDPSKIVTETWRNDKGSIVGTGIKQWLDDGDPLTILKGDIKNAQL